MITVKRPPAFVPQEGNSKKLYILTLIIELFTSVWLRGALFALIITVPLAVSFGILIVNDNGLIRFLVLLLALILSFSVFVVAFGPLVASIVAYLRYGGGNTATRFSLGAREPSTREMDQITTAQRAILSAATANGVTSVKGLSDVFVVDSPMEFVYLVGTTMYFSSGSFGSKYFQSLLAHELGHNQNNDGATILALRRLVFPVSYLFIRNVRDFSTGRLTATREGESASPSDVFYSMVNGLIFFVLSLVGGGVGTWLLSWSWAGYFRERDFLADKFVVACDLKDELIAYLEENRFYDTSVPFMLNWQPANEQRIDKLEPREAIHVVEEVPNEPDEDFITLFERVVREERLKRGGTLVVEEKPNESVVSLSDRLWKVYPNLSDEEAEDLVESRFFEALWEIEQIERRKGDLERELPAWVKEYIEEKERDK